VIDLRSGSRRSATESPSTRADTKRAPKILLVGQADLHQVERLAREDRDAVPTFSPCTTA